MSDFRGQVVDREVEVDIELVTRLGPTVTAARDERGVAGVHQGNMRVPSR